MQGVYSVVVMLLFYSYFLLTSENGAGALMVRSKITLEKPRVIREESRRTWDEFALSWKVRELSSKIKPAKQPEVACYVDVCLRNLNFKDYQAFQEVGYKPTNYALIKAFLKYVGVEKH